MKAYTHPSGHLRLSLTKQEADFLTSLLQDYEVMLSSHGVESFGYSDLNIFSNNLSDEISLSMARSELKKKNDIEKSKPTIYANLKQKLGREPMGIELKREVKRIIEGKEYMKTNIKEQGDMELVNIVFNDELAYAMLKSSSNSREVFDYVVDNFEYREEQWREFVDAVEHEREESDGT